MALTVTNGIDCYKWHRLLQMVSTAYEREMSTLSVCFSLTREWQCLELG